MEDLAELDADGVTVLLRECGHTDLVFALQAAADQTRQKILGLMPERMRLYMERDIEQLSHHPQTDPGEFQRLVLQQVNRRIDVSDEPQRMANLEPEHRAMRAALQQKLALQRGVEPEAMAQELRRTYAS